MISKSSFREIIANRKPVLAYNPPGLSDVSLAAAVTAAGGIGLVDLERLSTKECQELLLNCQQKIGDLWGVRVCNNEQLELLLDLCEHSIPSIVIIANFIPKKEQVQKINSREIALLAEVTSLQEAYEKPWAKTFLVKGYEAAGRVGDETSYILAQQFVDAGLSFIAQGGIGLYTAAAVFAVGAQAIVLDTQLYLTHESPLSDENKTFLSKIDATDTRILGQSTNNKYRVYARLGTKIVKEFLEKEKKWLSLSIEERTRKIEQEIFSEREMFNSKNIANSLIPIGQDIPFARILTEKFSSVKGIINGLLKHVQKQLSSAKESFPFKEGSDLSKDLGVKYSLIQGPMANVSESPAFAKVVASEGALPFLALGSLFKNQTRTLISKTIKELGALPFGCGIIGLEANTNALMEHLKILRELKPPFVVVAAGTIEQAKEVMSYGIKTFLHTPSPAIFAEAIEADVNYLVLEGMECGGHIGVLTSFVLWELALHQLVSLREKQKIKERKVNVAFAGGIGDRYSAAMVGVIASALPELMNGMMWVGTAYILTKEIIETGALKPLYQQEALEANETIVLGETVNTRARAIPTPFVKEIIRRELERLEKGMSLKERKHQYERDNLGATRVAALGEIWNPEGEDDKPDRFMPVDEDVQYQKGNYLIGQIVASLRSVRTVRNLHKELIEEPVKVLAQKGTEFIQRLELVEKALLLGAEPPSSSTDILGIIAPPSPAYKPLKGEGVAIIGLGGVFPDAPTIKVFWENILNGINSIKEIPKERWSNDIDLFYDPDPSTPDKSYAKIAASIKDFKFNSLDFKIPPKVANSIDNVQKIALVAAKEALEDAGLLSKEFNNERTAVIIGNSMGGEIRIEYNRRIYLPEVLKSIENSPSFKEVNPDAWQRLREEIEREYKGKLRAIDEDSMPGELANIIAGRIANVFNLQGKNMTCDAACASSLAALDVAVKGLLDNEYDIALCGGADCLLDPPTFIKFSKIGALSAEGSFPFDERANGFVMGEGAGFCVLKRLSDAIKDNDRIYAVIRGLGASSDGKGRGITAPNPRGQQLAIERALEQAGIDFSAVQFIEAHGTSTSVGDVVEMEVLQKVAKNVPPASISIGSIKSQIGHLKSAAGIASIIKTTLALHHKILPPSINFEKPNSNINWNSSPVYVNTQVKEWVKPEKGVRIAGVSSFGFGGTNFHTILEEYVPGVTQGHLPRMLSPAALEELSFSSGRGEASLREAPSIEEIVLDEAAWQEHFKAKSPLETEAIFFGADSSEALVTEIQKFKNDLPESTFGINGKGLRIRDLAQESISALSKDYRVGGTCRSFEDLPKVLDSSIEGLRNRTKRSFLSNKGIFFGEDHSIGKLAFLFPGQGSQYVKMLWELWEKFEIVRSTFREADKITKEKMGLVISEVIFALGFEESKAVDLLRKTEITQPAMFVADIAIYRLLSSFGVKPDYVAGHSLGEFAALVAAGVLSFEDALMAVIARGKAMSNLDLHDKGMMASIAADFETTEEVLKEVDGHVISANKNSQKQTVIAGETTAVAEAIKAFSARGINVIPLPVSAAFHSKLVAPAEKELRETLKKLTYNKPSIIISSNVTAKPYPKSKKEIISLLCKQVTSPVEWMKQVEEMYHTGGVRTFIEVGPKHALTSFVKTILEGEKDFRALASNHPKKGAMQHFHEVIAALGAFGYPLAIPKTDDPIYSEEFKEPRKRFYRRRVIEGNLEQQLQRADTISAAMQSVTSPPLGALLNEELNSLVSDPTFEDYLALQAPAIRAFLTAGYKAYKDLIASTLKDKEVLEKLEIDHEMVSVTGISIGLPGKNRKVFDESNFDSILAGENFIDLIPMEIREKMVDKNIIRLVKDAVNGATFQPINDVSMVIKLAAQKGEFDLEKEYGVPADFVSIFDTTIQLSFAAGIEALRDAGIPLVPLKVKTSVGKYITKGWALPESLRDSTGVIFASAFPGYSNLLSIVSHHLSDKYTNKNREEIKLLFKELISQISDEPSRAKVRQWFKENWKPEESLPFEFSRKFLFEILSMGHSQFAQFIRARGPNTQINAACSSTTQAIAIAEDWIRTGRCERVILIAADDVTNEQMLEWIASGFLAVGAATTSDNVEEAALPFDRRRHGMIIGMGAAGIVLESESVAKKRGVKPITDLMGTHIANSAFHGTRLDREHISSQMSDFITKIEKRFNISREEIARQLVFVSHETYTPARGGSASAEVDALRKTFGSFTDQIVIANTKGFTGHAMGAGIEDVVAVKILEKGIVPPVANWKEVDPELGVLNLSKGGHYDVKYALRLAAGFGSQLALALFRLNTQNGRFEGRAYDDWLASLGGSRDSLEIVNKTLRMKVDLPLLKPKPPELTTTTSINLQAANNQIAKTIIDLIAEKTGYPLEIIEPDMHLEEDLGIDTVKQAELFGFLRTKYNLPREEGVRIQDYYSVNKIVEYISSRLSSEEKAGMIDSAVAAAASPPAIVGSSSAQASNEEIAKKIIDLIVEKTGYPREMIEPDMHLEEDLGIDTVKQAELFGILRSQYNLPREEGVRIQDYFSVNKIAEYLSTKLGSSDLAKITSSIDEQASPLSVKAPIEKAIDDKISNQEIMDDIIDLIVEKTGYPKEMIETDMELEEDLGIDTVKQAEIFGILRTKWNLPREEGIRIQDYSTVNKIVDYILNRIRDTPKISTEVVADTTISAKDVYVPAKRLILQLIDAPMPKTEKIKLKDKKFIVVGETGPVTTEIISLLESKKAKLVKYLDLKILRSRDKILKKIPEEVIDGLIYIEPKTNQKNKHNLTARIFFTLCRDITYSDSPLILTISNTVTSFGWNGKCAPIAGSITGLTKAIAREFSNGRVKCVSCIDPKLAIDEICAGDGSIEVSYTEDGKRRVFITVESPVEVTDQPFTITKDELVVITGGALGITYEVTKELAKRYQPKLALIGIEKLPENVDEIANYNQERLAQLKEQMISDLKQKNERVTPVLIEKEWSKIIKAVDVKKAIEELTAIGCVVKYYSADVVNTELMKATFEKIKSDFDQEIVGIIHGAGIESSKLIADKKPEEFDLVYNVKAIGFDNLVQNINLKKVKFFICFSSVAGRYGNVGQVDYSAANDYLSKNCWQLRSKGIRATSICWSAWGEVGMATRGSIMTVLKRAGVTPITVADGVNAFLNELEYGLEPEVVIAGKIGVLMESPSNYLQVNKKLYPLIGKIKRNFDGSIVTEREFSLEDDLYLDHHRIDNVPYLPGVIGLELFAELAKLAFPKSKLAGFNDVEFRSAIKFINDKSRILKARIDYSTKNPDCTLASEFVKDGVRVGKPNIHFKAKVVLGRRKEEITTKPKLQKGELASKKTIYSILPHGPLFQVLKEISQMNKEIVALSTFSKLPQFNWEYRDFVSDPLAIESAFQTMGLMDIIKDNRLGLPFSIKSLVFNKSKGTPLIVRGYKKAETDLGSVFDFEILTRAGEVVLKATDYSTVQIDLRGNMEEVEKIRLERIKQLFDIPKEAKLEVVSVQQLKERINQEPTFVQSFLHPDEQEKLATLKVDKRRDEWLAGVFAAKTALNQLLGPVALQRVKIEKSELGEPYFLLPKDKKQISLSITHSNGYAVAVVSPSNKIGIDLEVIEKRSKALVEEVLGPKEQELFKKLKKDIADELLTKIWTAKEAASKALGLGLNVDLHAIRITDFEEGKLIIQVDPKKIPEISKTRKIISKERSDVELIARIVQNEEFVAAVCQFSSA